MLPFCRNKLWCYVKIFMSLALIFDTTYYLKSLVVYASADLFIKIALLNVNADIKGKILGIFFLLYVRVFLARSIHVVMNKRMYFMHFAGRTFCFWNEGFLPFGHVFKVVLLSFEHFRNETFDVGNCFSRDQRDVFPFSYL